MTSIPTGLYYLEVAESKPKETTRQKILAAAFHEFYRHGFQGGSLNHIVEVAGATKGAVFHHFSCKQDLVYAVVDELIGPLLKQRWLDPLTGSANPLVDLKRVFRQFVKEDIASGSWVYGCPLNNLAQEMSPLDEGFRLRIDELYSSWRACYTAVLAAGVKSGKVRKDVSPRNVAALLVASQMGIWGTGKYSQNQQLMLQATDAVCEYLDSLKP